MVYSTSINNPVIRFVGLPINYMGRKMEWERLGVNQKGLLEKLAKWGVDELVPAVVAALDNVRLNLINYFVGFIPCKNCLYFSN